MNLKVIRNAITSKTARQVLLVQKHSPTVLMAAGVVGFVGTIVLASKATLKLENVVGAAQDQIDKATYLHNEDRDDYTDTDYRNDMTLIYIRTVGKIAKLYGPSLVVGATTIACLVGSHRILSSRNAGLMAAYAALDQGFKEYRARVLEAVGEDRERELRYGSVSKEIVEETDTGPQTKTISRVGQSAGKSIYARFFDESNQNWVGNPMYNRVFLQSQQNYANEMLKARGHVFLNDVYDALGLERTPAGAVVGWVTGVGDDYVDFGIFEGKYPAVRDFVNGNEASILLDFNVAGVIYDKI